ncbi:MAG TPA: MerR family transcriptional regulator [Chloroflexota bacterium]|nr:MerR family transcriptional regulator [Chloroflexota bacterium]
MDGRGRYYRWSTKATVNDLDNLDIMRLAETVDFERPAYYRWQWTRKFWNSTKKSTIGFTVVPGEGLRLNYVYGGEEISPYIAPIVTTRPHFGGKRYWFLCPNVHCRRRCRILYGGKYFLCRTCQDLTYVSSQTTAGPDRVRVVVDNRRRAIRRKLGDQGDLSDPLPAKPTGMHWRTYGRLAIEYRDLSQLADVAMTESMAQLLPDYSFPLDSGVLWDAHKREDWDAAYREEILHFLAALERGTDSDEDDRPERLTLGELAQRAGVPYAFAKEVQAEGLIAPDAGRAKRRKRYRPKLASWLGKLYTLREAGMAWEEIRQWSKRRFQPGHEHERRWPAEYQPER